MTLIWTEAGWREQAAAWIGMTLSSQGLSLTGPIEQSHVRPWSTVLTAPTGRGRFFFKATLPALGFEPRLTRALAGWRPDCMPQVLAIEPDRGWMLLADGGVPLRSLLSQERQPGRWRTILALYAGLQHGMAARRDDLLALGALDRRLESLPAQFEALLADREALLIDRPDGLSAADYRRLHELAPRFAAMCRRLADYGIPETLHHDDFHDGNILVAGERITFFDWAESCLAHPFFTLVVTLRNVAWTLKLAGDAAEIDALREVYLDGWSGYGSRADLRAACRLADQIGRVNRAMTWHRVVSSLPEPHRSENAEAVPGWLQEFLAVMP